MTSASARKATSTSAAAKARCTRKPTTANSAIRARTRSKKKRPGTVKRLTALGGSLRSQSVLRNHSLANHATLLSGSVLRVNPDTGEGVPGNPYYASTEKNAQRIVAFGFRQPWRFTINDRLGKLFVDNVGNGSYEEIERLTLGSAPSYNGGWPCYEGYENGKPARNYSYSGQYEEHGEIIHDPSIQYCIDQYKAEDEGHPGTETPFYAYPHNGPVVPGDRLLPRCALWRPTSAAMRSTKETDWPKAYNNAFFFSDAIRGCIYVMLAGCERRTEPGDGDDLPLRQRTVSPSPASTSSRGRKATSSTPSSAVPVAAASTGSSTRARIRQEGTRRTGTRNAKRPRGKGRNAKRPNAEKREAEKPPARPIDGARRPIRRAADRRTAADQRAAGEADRPSAPRSSSSVARPGRGTAARSTTRASPPAGHPAPTRT